MAELVKQLDAIGETRPFEEFKAMFVKCDAAAKAWNDLQRTCTSRASEASRGKRASDPAEKKEKKKPKVQKKGSDDDMDGEELEIDE
jgi:hypothetical protein